MNTVVLFEKSTAIKSVEFDAIENRLTIAFKSGATYLFKGVDETTYNELITAESVGKFVAARISSVFKYERVEVAADQPRPFPTRAKP